MLPSGKFSKFAPAAAGLLFLLLIFAIEGIPPSAASLLISNVLQAAVVLLAAFCSFHVARHSGGYLQRLWTLFAASLFMGGTPK